MNLVEAVNILDGNSYIIKSAGSGSTSGGLEFDSIYNKICVEKDLDSIFQSASKKYGVDVNLLKAVGFVESTFRADAVSKSGAMGVMQLMPYTAESYGVKDPFDATQNINGGAKLLADLLEKYDGNITLSVAAYNAGSGAVDRSGGVPDIEQTINYVKKINNVLGGALDNDSWTIEGSEPTIITSTDKSEADIHSGIIIGSVYAGFIQPTTSGAVVSQGGTSDSSSAGISYGTIFDGSPYAHYVINSQSNRNIITEATE